jgi:drug/metabolite transporter (DMT)-like permease
VIGDLGRLTRSPAAQSWQRFWQGLPANMRGALWLILACLFIATMGALVKTLGEHLDSFELAFFRAAFGLVSVLPFACRAGLGVLRTHRLGLHVARGTAGSIGMMCMFYALTHLTLAEATAITFTSPLFLTVLAAVVLHETVRRRRWSATAVGFFGVLVMLRPGDGVLEAAALVALLGALGIAVVRLLIKQLSRTEAPLTMIVYLGLIGTVVSAIPAILVWRTPTLWELCLLLLLGGVSNLSQVCMIRGYKIGEASALAPFEYARLPFAALWGYFLFAELPDLYTLLGASIIVGSTLYIVRREQQLSRAAKAASAPAPPDSAP